MAMISAQMTDRLNETLRVIDVDLAEIDELRKSGDSLLIF